MAGHLTLGSRAERVHVRLWEVPRGTLAAAHFERLGERHRHVVLSWDAARARLAEDLEAAGFARIASTGVVTLPALRGVKAAQVLGCKTVHLTGDSSGFLKRWALQFSRMGVAGAALNGSSGPLLAVSGEGFPPPETLRAFWESSRALGTNRSRSS